VEAGASSYDYVYNNNNNNNNAGAFLGKDDMSQRRRWW